jgi:predicted O-linked N-acetylglucosamine transferase (SPINDLY family)
MQASWQTSALVEVVLVVDVLVVDVVVVLVVDVVVVVAPPAPPAPVAVPVVEPPFVVVVPAPSSVTVLPHAVKTETAATLANNQAIVPNRMWDSSASPRPARRKKDEKRDAATPRRDAHFLSKRNDGASGECAGRARPLDLQTCGGAGARQGRRGAPGERRHAWPAQPRRLESRAMDAIARARAAMSEGRLDDAAEAIAGVPDGEAAREVAARVADALNTRGNELASGGRAGDAEAAYRRALAIAPGFYKPLNNLANLLARRGALEESAELYRRALALAPDADRVRANLGNVLAGLGRAAEAEACWREAIARGAELPKARVALAGALASRGALEEAAATLAPAAGGDVAAFAALLDVAASLGKRGRIDAAIAAHRAASAARPDDAAAPLALVALLRAHGRADAALAELAAAARRLPRAAAIAIEHGRALADRGRPAEAIAELGRAVALAPGDARALVALADATWRAGDAEAALPLYERAISLAPDLVDAHIGLGDALGERMRLAEASAAYARAIAIDPASIDAAYGQASAELERGRVVEAVAIYRRILEGAPDYATAHSNLLFAMHYDAAFDPATIFAEHRAWARAHAPARVPRPSPVRGRDPERRLRVGYLSADLLNHSVARFLVPALAERDRERFRVFAYSDAARRDAVTARIEALVDGLRPVHGLSNEAVAEAVRRDEIDVLVDLMGHTQGARLRVLALRPAPVQVSWLGYPDTTGLEAVDARLTDAVADPPGEADARHVERLVRLPRTAWCFSSLGEDAPVGPSPLLRGRPPTFGSFNALPKVREETLATWAAIVREVPGSRLLVKARGLADEGARADVLATLARHGVSADRVDLRGWASRAADHLGLYAEVDVALDTFPYAGTTTTCEALFMGVPVVTLAGATHVARVGASLVRSAGAPELVARSTDEYRAIATGLVADPARLAALRASLRAGFPRSALGNARAFARDIEAAYRDLWRGTWAG